MDTEVLNSITDCKAIKRQDDSTKPCCYWYDILGVCRKPSNVKCPQGIPEPSQEVADSHYNSLG